MKKILNRRKKLNNKGMTLIELMVAVAILSVAIIPLMYAFINSMKYNAKGRELQQTTVLAHTIMEKCKGYTTKEIDDRMDNHTFLDTLTVGALNNSTKTPMTGATTLWGSSGSLADDGTETYYIGMVQLENQRYDVQVTLDNHGRQDLYNGTSDIDSSMIHTESMNKYMDAVFTVNTVCNNAEDTEIDTVAGLDFEAYSEMIRILTDGIKADAATKPSITEEVNVPLRDLLTLTTGKLNLYRYIDITANNDGAGRDVVNVTYTYTFTLDGGVFSYNYNPPSGGATIPLSVDVGTNEVPLYNLTFTIYDNAATMANGAVLENIYFFYYPAYNGDLTDYPISEDIITINNNTGRYINFYMVKQKNPVYSDVDLNTLEGVYEPYITVAGGVVFYHNSDQNLGGSGPANPFHLVSTGALTYPRGTLYDEENKILMYDVKVSIYPAGSYNGSDIVGGAEPIITLNGTMLDW